MNGTNFNVGKSILLNNLNDIYGTKQSYQHVPIPSSKFEVDQESITYASQREALAQIPHYMSSGLVICNPDVFAKFVPREGNLCLLRKKAAEAYATLCSFLRSCLVYDDGSSYFKAASSKGWGGAKKTVLPTLLDGPPSGEFVIIPQSAAMTLFGPKVVDEYYPAWLQKNAIFASGIDLSSSPTLQDVAHHVIITTSPPPHVDLVSIFGKVLSTQIPMTKPLTMQAVLRSEPLDQMTVVAYCVHQFQMAMKNFVASSHRRGDAYWDDLIRRLAIAASRPTHQSRGILILPCGIGKTLVGLNIWHSLFDSDFDDLEGNDFGIIRHKIEKENEALVASSTASSSQSQPPPPAAVSASNIFKKISKQQMEAKSGAAATKETPFYDAWLKRHPGIHDRSTKPRVTGKLLWIADNDELLDQTIDAIEKVLPDAVVDILKASSRPDPTKCDIVVASIRTVVRQSNFPASYFGNFTMCIFDEAHRLLALHFRKVFAKLSQIPLFLFLTATPRHHALRLIGGPVYVCADRPYVSQQHKIIIISGLDPATRPMLYMQMGRKRGSTGAVPPNLIATGSNTRRQNLPMDALGMAQDLVTNHARNTIVIDLIYHICRPTATAINGPPLSGNNSKPSILRVSQSPLMDSSCSYAWNNLFNASMEHHKKPGHNVTPLHRQHIPGFQLTPQPDHAINIHNKFPDKWRVPLVFSSYVPHLIQLQHSMAQFWMDRAKEMDKYKHADLMIVRIGLRCIAVIDANMLSEEQASRITYIGGGANDEHDSLNWTQDKDVRTLAGTRKLVFNESFWRKWFAVYPICKRHAERQRTPFPFKVESERAKTKKGPPQKKKLTAAAKNAVPSSNAASTDSLKSTKDFTATTWTYVEQYKWTPIYYPLPGAAATPKAKRVRRVGKKPGNKTIIIDPDMEPSRGVKRGRDDVLESDDDDQDDDELDPEDVDQDETSTSASEDGLEDENVCDVGDDDQSPTNEDAVRRPSTRRGGELFDTRPPLTRESGCLLATFGLYIGKGTYPAPYSQLSDRRITLKRPHNAEALQSDYVFANYAVASTGIDREDVDTTVMVTPHADPEQVHGRALRICKSKQPVLHVEFGEPAGGKHMLQHAEGMHAQGVTTEVFVAIAQQGSH